MPKDNYVVDRCSEIEDRLRYAERKSKSDPELGAYLAEYISVLIAGVVEDTVEHLVIMRASKLRDPHIEEFVRSSIDMQFRSPKSRDISNVLKRFSAGYANSYDKVVSHEAREALGSIVSNRMSLAHRGSPNSQFTVNDIRAYFGLIVGILEVVELILLGDDSP